MDKNIGKAMQRAVQNKKYIKIINDIKTRENKSYAVGEIIRYILVFKDESGLEKYLLALVSAMAKGENREALDEIRNEVFSKKLVDVVTKRKKSMQLEEQNEKIFDYLNKNMITYGYIFHAFNGSFKASIEKYGINSERKVWDDDKIDDIDDILSGYGIENIFGTYDTTPEQTIYLTANCDNVYDYAKSSPYWFSQFVCESKYAEFNKESIYNKDYPAAREIVDLLLRQKNVKEIDKIDIIKFFEWHWQMFMSERYVPYFALIERSNIEILKGVTLYYHKFKEQLKNVEATPKEIVKYIFDIADEQDDIKIHGTISPDRYILIQLPNYTVVKKIVDINEKIKGKIVPITDDLLFGVINVRRNCLPNIREAFEIRRKNIKQNLEIRKAKKAKELDLKINKSIGTISTTELKNITEKYKTAKIDISKVKEELEKTQSLPVTELVNSEVLVTKTEEIKEKKSEEKEKIDLKKITEKYMTAKLDISKVKEELEKAEKEKATSAIEVPPVDEVVQKLKEKALNPDYVEEVPKIEIKQEYDPVVIYENKLENAFEEENLEKQLERRTRKKKEKSKEQVETISEIKEEKQEEIPQEINKKEKIEIAEVVETKVKEKIESNIELNTAETQDKLIDEKVLEEEYLNDFEKIYNNILNEKDLDVVKAEEEAKAKAEEEARIKAEEEAKAKAEEEARIKAEEEAKAKSEEEARIKAEEEAKAKAEEEVRIKAEEEAKAKAEEEARIKAEEEAKAKAEEEARIKAEEEAKARAEEEARIKAEEEAKAKAEEEARIKAEEEAKAKAEEEARIKAEEEAKAKAKAEEEARIKAEEEAKAKAEEEARIKAEEEAKAKAEEEARIKAEEEAKAKAEEEARIKAEEEAKAKAEEEARIKAEEEAKAKAEQEKIQKEQQQLLEKELELIEKQALEVSKVIEQELMQELLQASTTEIVEKAEIQETIETPEIAEAAETIEKSENVDIVSEINKEENTIIEEYDPVKEYEQRLIREEQEKELTQIRINEIENMVPDEVINLENAEALPENNEGTSNIDVIAEIKDMDNVSQAIEILEQDSNVDVTVSKIDEIIVENEDAKLVDALSIDEVKVTPVVDDELYNYEDVETPEIISNVTIEDSIAETNENVPGALIEEKVETIVENEVQEVPSETVFQQQTEELSEEQKALTEEEIIKLVEQDELSLNSDGVILNESEIQGQIVENEEYTVDPEMTAIALVNNSFAEKLRKILNQFTSFITVSQEPGMSKTPKVSKTQKINVYGTYADYKKRNKIDRVINVMNDKPLKVKRVHHSKEYCKKIIHEERDAFIEELYKEINTKMYKFESENVYNVAE